MVDEELKPDSRILGQAARQPKKRLARFGSDRSWHSAAFKGRPMIVFLAHFLIVLAAWTVTIKFLFPIAYALGEGAPLDTYIYWDFWWVVHLWLAWALLRWQPYAYALALGVSTVEIAIVVTKLVLFLADP